MKVVINACYGGFGLSYHGVIQYAVLKGIKVYVLHCFQKKSKKGIQTPKKDIDLIRKRLKVAEDHYKKNYKKGR